MKRICLISFLGTLGLFAQSPRFSFSVDSVAVDFETVYPKETTLKVYLGAQFSEPSKTPIIGKTLRTATGFVFYPWAPLQREVTYTIVWEGNTQNFNIPRETEYEALRVISVFPNTETVPANLLKWYIEFSRPVNPTKIYDHITLVDASGMEVERAILPLSTPLLSKDGKTLTLWMEPGRQKRDLGPNERLGAVMQPHKAYTLKIGRELKDRNGLFLGRDYQHHFKTVAQDRESPDTDSWRLELPEVGTNEGLHLEFMETLDYGSLHGSFAIIAPNGEELEGNFEYRDASLDFYPKVPWKRGAYKIQFNKRIEDVAGNNLERLFDRDITKPLRKQSLERTFTIGD